MNVTLDQARTIVEAALAHAVDHGYKPLGVAVLDSRGALVAYAAQDGTSLGRAEVALAKAKGALLMGMGSRNLMRMAQDRPAFIGALSAVYDGKIIPGPGGVLIRSGAETIGAVGVSGDTADNDEAAALAGITAAGLQGDGG
jgi:uncharacterized protein GlcG (DUF336 family)